MMNKYRFENVTNEWKSFRELSVRCYFKEMPFSYFFFANSLSLGPIFCERVSVSISLFVFFRFFLLVSSWSSLRIIEQIVLCPVKRWSFEQTLTVDIRQENDRFPFWMELNFVNFIIISIGFSLLTNCYLLEWLIIKRESDDFLSLVLTVKQCK